MRRSFDIASIIPKIEGLPEKKVVQVGQFKIGLCHGSYGYSPFPNCRVDLLGLPLFVQAIPSCLGGIWNHSPNSAAKWMWIFWSLATLTRTRLVPHFVRSVFITVYHYKLIVTYYSSSMCWIQVCEYEGGYFINPGSITGAYSGLSRCVIWAGDLCLDDSTHKPTKIQQCHSKFHSDGNQRTEGTQRWHFASDLSCLILLTNHM